MGFFSDFFSAFFKPDDWTKVWSQSCRWLSQGREVSRCLYEIHYSPSRNQYKLRMMGDDPEGHKYYRKAQRLLAYLAHFHDLFGNSDAALEESLKHIKK